MLPSTPFAQYVRSHKRELVERWVELSREDESFRWARVLRKDQFEDGIPEVLDSLADFLESPPDVTAASLSMNDVMDHGHDRWKLGFNLTGLLRDWGKLRETLTEAVDGFFASEDGTERISAHRRVARFFTEASCASVERFDEVRRAEASSVSEDLDRMRSHFERLQQARSELLHEASHDIKSGLSAISGISGLLLGHPEAPKDEKLGKIIKDSVSAVVKILNSLMELNRLEAGKEKIELEEFDLAEQLRGLGESFRQVAEEKGLAFKVEGDPGITIRSDAGKVRRIVQNLLVNAIKYTMAGSVVLSWQRKDRFCEVRVIDTGPGMRGKLGLPVIRELDENPHASDSGRDESGSNSLGYDGEGIGLTIVKRLCSMLRIPLDLHSEDGKGTTFTLCIPFDGPSTDGSSD